uniref:Uncharacterized protein n=1 Tax=Colobus angolensis palliatus TaxID=336983 RepID=A0A2K5KA96_COLAP
MRACLTMRSLPMPACLLTRHPSLCPRRTMPVTSGCRMPSTSASEELGGRGCAPMQKAQKLPLRQEGQACIPQRRNCQTLSPPLPMVLGLHFFHMCAPPAWPTLSLAVGPEAFSPPLGISGIGLSAWLPFPPHLLLLSAAAGSGVRALSDSVKGGTISPFNRH